jgi:hypothetical protein
MAAAAAPHSPPSRSGHSSMRRYTQSSRSASDGPARTGPMMGPRAQPRGAHFGASRRRLLTSAGGGSGRSLMRRARLSRRRSPFARPNYHHRARSSVATAAPFSCFIEHTRSESPWRQRARSLGFGPSVQSGGRIERVQFVDCVRRAPWRLGSAAAASGSLVAVWPRESQHEPPAWLPRGGRARGPECKTGLGAARLRASRDRPARRAKTTDAEIEMKIMQSDRPPAAYHTSAPLQASAKTILVARAGARS